VRGKGSGFPASSTNGLITDPLIGPLRHPVIMPLDFRLEIDNADSRFKFVERGSKSRVDLAPFLLNQAARARGGGVSGLVYTGGVKSGVRAGSRGVKKSEPLHHGCGHEERAAGSLRADSNG